ncbi:SurA N-terminal domain-containing protein [Spirochaeta africana]|uniref:Periplasmic chaperone PpiD n=1 Tax=Spirochaeta africana (strain ATCC 700263 / DSM 8902 / Z-7692) TaxID=889378 RepID=H9UK74_SPIAZ|nr:SurA N-terminal domain-containing protein [Spirochaeta africana]AFG37917.1 parvulin-like peptidyl-prolyl isomerase [Spirochaeta africana DSM 8902]
MASKKDSNISRFPEKEPGKKTGSRRTGLYIFSVTVLVIIVVTFIGGPLIGSIGGPQAGGRLIFGYYRRTPIEYAPGNYFARQLQMLERQFAQSGMEQQDTQMQVFQIWRGAYDRTLLHTAVLHQAERSNIPVSSEQVDQAIARNPEFQEDGRFSLRRYERLSPQQQYQLREITRENLLHERYLNDMLQHNLAADNETAHFAGMASPERRISYVSFRYNQYPEGELQAFVQERPELFQSIEAASITLRRDQHSREDAEAIRDRILADEISFGEAARTYSADMFAEIGGDAGELYFYDLLPDYPSEQPLESVFTTAEGEIAPVVESNFGYVIYRINRAARDASPDDQNILNEARSYLQDFERGRIADYFAGLAQEFATDARDNGFTAAASTRDIEVHETDFFAINYGELPYFSAPARNTELGNVSTNRNFFEASFGTPLDAVTEPVALQDRVIVLTPVEERDAESSRQEMLSGFYPSFVQQSAGTRLENILLNPDHIDDRFMDTLFTHVLNLEG